MKIFEKCFFVSLLQVLLILIYLNLDQSSFIKKIHIDWFMKYNVAETDNHFFVTALNDNVKLQNYNTSNLEFICQDKTKTSIMDSISMK